jgi:hypothetical protein
MATRGSATLYSEYFVGIATFAIEMKASFYGFPRLTFTTLMNPTLGSVFQRCVLWLHEVSVRFIWNLVSASG